MNDYQELSVQGRHMVTFADQVPCRKSNTEKFNGKLNMGSLQNVQYIESYKKFNKLTVTEIERKLSSNGSVDDSSDEEVESCVHKINKVLNSCEGCQIF